MFTNYLVPITNDSTNSKNLKFIAEMAKSDKAHITLLFVSDPMVPYMYTEGMVDYYAVSTSMHEKSCIEYAERLFAKAQKFLGDDVKSKTAHVFHSVVFEGIIAAAKKHKSDVIIMASHKRRGLEGVFLGSDTHAVITHTKLPVLVI